ncbi:hypothetical protein PVAG01_02243 [Phlyctema vagabunda]|uniref:Uncharacterized protein n=1 Tax=Phlyctema vagabunda TaxID=108571 RepID=A0ABR4PQP6_9HELO
MLSRLQITALSLLLARANAFTCPSTLDYRPACCDSVSVCAGGEFEGFNCFEAFPFPADAYSPPEFTCILHDEVFGDSLQGTRACCRDVVDTTAQCVEPIGEDV